MPKMVVTHAVEDVNTWLKGKSERAEAISAMGGSNVVDLVAQDGSNNIAITADTDDLEAVLAATSSPSPELAAAMQSHGVIPPLMIYIEK
jgi:hypothetical protein